MKTTDGSELKKGHYYYLENGQCVCLEDFAETPSGEQKFVVVPFYEGETMTVSGDGGSHSEYTAEYEHEGEPMLVSSIFDKAPTEKLCSRYRDKAEEVTKLALSIGSLQKTISTLMIKQRDVDKLTIEAQKRIVHETKELGKVNAQVAEVEETLSTKRQQLSELEDSIVVRSPGDVNTMISTAELQLLKKRDFRLECLEHGGVDNWDWYSESLKIYNERYPEG